MKRIWLRTLCLLLALCCLPPAAFGEEEDWYQDMLAASHLSLGNNLRLKRVIQQARAGEEITIAVIGGSVTEGAGAKQYKECWAYRTAAGFRQRYGVGDGAHIRLVNGAVSGTDSVFGLMRYQRDVLDKVKDPDGLPDLVIIEYAVNDGQEPTRHQAYESLVKQVLDQPNHPAVILLFAVFDGGYTLQNELRRVGAAYDLMMVSIRDSAYRQIGTRWTSKEFFSDSWHPTSLGHGVMADCILSAIEAAEAQPTAEADITTDVKPAFGTGYMGIRTIYASEEHPELALSRGGFNQDDKKVYRNNNTGRVCGTNFAHSTGGPDEPLTFTATFSKLLVAWRVCDKKNYGKAEVVVDGRVMRTLGAGSGDWGQPLETLCYNNSVSAEHQVEIRMAGDTSLPFTIVCISYVP